MECIIVLTIFLSGWNFGRTEASPRPSFLLTLKNNTAATIRKILSTCEELTAYEEVEVYGSV